MWSHTSAGHVGGVVEREFRDEDRRLEVVFPLITMKYTHTHNTEPYSPNDLTLDLRNMSRERSKGKERSPEIRCCL